MAITIPVDGYCEASDVQALSSLWSFSATSTPTTTQVETWIKQIKAEIDAMLFRIGYLTPVVITREQLITTGSLVTRTAHQINDTTLELSATTMDGAVLAGDVFLITGDNQYYQAIDSIEIAEGDEQVDVHIWPPLRTAPAAGVAVTYSFLDQPENFLKNLNALGVAARVEDTAIVGSNIESESARTFRAQYQDAWDRMEKGKAVLIGARRVSRGSIGYGCAERMG